MPAGHPAEVVRSEAVPARDGVPDDAVLSEFIGDAQFALIGEALFNDAFHDTFHTATAVRPWEPHASWGRAEARWTFPYAV